MKKKALISFLIATATLSTTLVGCGSTEETTTDTGSDTTVENEGDSSTDEPVTITVYEHMTNGFLGEEVLDEDGNTVRDPETAYERKIADDFTAETGINVEFVGYANEGDVLPLLKTGDPGVDIFSNGGNYTREQIDTYFEPVMTLDEAEEMFGSLEKVQSIAQDENGLYWWPMGECYNNAVVYNEEALQSVGYDGIPETVEEFYTMCEKLRDSGITPIALHRVENWPLSVVASFADYEAGEAGSLTNMLALDEPFDPETSPIGIMLKDFAVLKANKMFEQEIYADFGVAMNEVAEGNAAMMLSGTWVVPQIQSRVPEGGDPSIIKFDAAPDFGNGRYVSSELAMSYGINKNSDNIEESKMFLDYLSQQPEFASNSGFIALREDVEPIVPDLYELVDSEIEAGEVTPLFPLPDDENFINADAVLNEADLKIDSKWATLPFDAIDVNNPDDFSAFYKQLEKQNEYYNDARDYLGVEWQE